MENLQAVLDAYFKAWNDGFESKNGDEIRSLMSRNFIGYWCHAKLDKPEEYDYTYDLNGVLAQYGTAEKLERRRLHNSDFEGSYFFN